VFVANISIENDLTNFVNILKHVQFVPITTGELFISVILVHKRCTDTDYPVNWDTQKPIYTYIIAPNILYFFTTEFGLYR